MALSVSRRQAAHSCIVFAVFAEAVVALEKLDFFGDMATPSLPSVLQTQANCRSGQLLQNPSSHIPCLPNH